MIITNYPMMMAGNQFKWQSSVEPPFLLELSQLWTVTVPLCTHSFNVQGGQKGRARTSWCAFLNDLFLLMIT